MMEATIPLSTMIRERRKALSLTQDALAALLGVEQTTVSAWETGQNRVDVERLPALADALGIDLAAAARAAAVRPAYAPSRRRGEGGLERADGEDKGEESEPAGVA